MFLHVSVILLTGGVCVVAPEGVGMCGCSRGGHAWLLFGGACMVAPGGACVVALGGCAWLLLGGGMRGIRRDTEIRSMSGRYASYWNAFLYYIELWWNCFIITDLV